MPGKSSRDKGARVEREIVNRLKEEGIDAKRVPLSGACVGYKDDIEALGFRFEVKARGEGQGFRMLLRWLGPEDEGDTDGLILRADRHEPMAVLRWGVFTSLLKSIRARDQEMRAQNAPGSQENDTP